MSASDRDPTGGPLDPAPSRDRADGTDQPEGLGVETDDRRILGQGEGTSPGGPPAEAYTSESLDVEQDSPNDSG